MSGPACMVPLLLTAMVAAAPAAPAAAAPPIQVRDAWSRPAMAGLPTAVIYMTLTNRGGASDRLEGASSPRAARISLHRSQMSAGVMSMQPVPDGLELPPGRAVALAPNGYHLMLDGLRGGLQVGQSYPVTLRFARAKPMRVTVQVRQGAGVMPAMATPAPR